MPRIVRPMRVEPDGLPRVENGSKCLGVREPPGPLDQLRPPAAKAGLAASDASHCASRARTLCRSVAINSCLVRNTG